MLKGIQALLGSEKAIAGGVLVICATVLAALGDMPVDQWTSYTEVIFGAYIVGKTTQGAVATWAEAKQPESKTESKVTIETATKRIEEPKTDAA